MKEVWKRGKWEGYVRATQSAGCRVTAAQGKSLAPLKKFAVFLYGARVVLWLRRSDECNAHTENASRECPRRIVMVHACAFDTSLTSSKRSLQADSQARTSTMLLDRLAWPPPNTKTLRLTQCEPPASLLFPHTCVYAVTREPVHPRPSRDLRDANIICIEQYWLQEPPAVQRRAQVAMVTHRTHSNQNGPQRQQQRYDDEQQNKCCQQTHHETTKTQNAYTHKPHKRTDD